MNIFILMKTLQTVARKSSNSKQNSKSNKPAEIT